MEAKQKNILIGGLIAVVLVMAVGYAAFATQLNINGTAEITSTWNVHFDSTKTLETQGVFTATGGALAGGGTGTAPTGTLSYGSGNLSATLGVTLRQPGDTATFTLTIINEGSISAQPGAPTITLDNAAPASMTTSGNNYIIDKGNIRFTVTKPTLTLSQNGTDTVVVTAEFRDSTYTGIPAHCTGYEGEEAPTTSEACESAGGAWQDLTTVGSTTTLTATQSAVLDIIITYTQAS